MKTFASTNLVSIVTLLAAFTVVTGCTTTWDKPRSKETASSISPPNVENEQEDKYRAEISNIHYDTICDLHNNPTELGMTNLFCLTNHVLGGGVPAVVTMGGNFADGSWKNISIDWYRQKDLLVFNYDGPNWHNVLEAPNEDIAVVKSIGAVRIARFPEKRITSSQVVIATNNLVVSIYTTKGLMCVWHSRDRNLLLRSGWANGTQVLISDLETDDIERLRTKLAMFFRSRNIPCDTND